MPLFNFSLKPIAECAPFGSAPDYRLHWFGLTDGFYHIKAGSEEIFRYTPEIMAEWEEQGYPMPGLHYPDYQVVRLYEDLLDILRYAYEPVPPEVARYVATPESQSQLDQMADRWWNQNDDDSLDEDRNEFIDQTAEAATSWWNYRVLDSGHLQRSPGIWFWRVGEQMHIRWKSGGKSEAGVPFWTSQRGEYTLPFAEFQAEVEDFHGRLMAEMQERVESACREWPLPEVHIDLDNLRQEQVEREKSLQKALAKPQQTDWKEVLAALKLQEEFKG